MSRPDVPPEEPWELEIHELLSSLPPVEPPEGFLARAVDHRPKYAARLSVAALSSVAVVALAIVGLGLVGDHVAVAPPVRAYDERHQVAAGLGGGTGRVEDLVFERISEPAEMVDVPAEFQPLGMHRDGELVQLVYEHDDRPVSIFVQPGSVDWDRLPAGGLTRVGDRPVWIDARRRLVVVEAGAYVVCVVGVEVDEVLRQMRPDPPDEVTPGDRLKSLAREVARQAGFP